MISHAFIHKNRTHLYNNLLGIILNAPAVEQEIGYQGLLFTFFGGCLAGCFNFNRMKQRQLHWQIRNKIQDSLSLSLKKATPFICVIGQTGDLRQTLLDAGRTIQEGATTFWGRTQNLFTESSSFLRSCGEKGPQGILGDAESVFKQSVGNGIDMLSKGVVSMTFDNTGYLGASAGVSALVGFDFLLSISKIYAYFQSYKQDQPHRTRPGRKSQRAHQKRQKGKQITTLSLALLTLKATMTSVTICTEIAQVLSAELKNRDCAIDQRLLNNSTNIDHLGHVLGYMFGFVVFFSSRLVA